MPFWTFCLSRDGQVCSQQLRLKKLRIWWELVSGILSAYQWRRRELQQAAPRKPPHGLRTTTWWGSLCHMSVICFQWSDKTWNVSDCCTLDWHCILSEGSQAVQQRPFWSCSYTASSIVAINTVDWKSALLLDGFLLMDQLLRGNLSSTKCKSALQTCSLLCCWPALCNLCQLA